MIQFLDTDKESLRLEKLRRLAEEVDRLGRQPPAVVNAPPAFGRIRRLYVDPATDELVVQVMDGPERRYTAV